MEIGLPCLIGCKCQQLITGQDLAEAVIGLLEEAEFDAGQRIAGKGVLDREERLAKFVIDTGHLAIGRAHIIQPERNTGLILDFQHVTAAHFRQAANLGRQVEADIAGIAGRKTA